MDSEHERQLNLREGWRPPLGQLRPQEDPTVCHDHQPSLSHYYPRSPGLPNRYQPFKAPVKPQGNPLPSRFAIRRIVLFLFCCGLIIYFGWKLIR